MGKLYIVGTPIGNLEDMTFRAAETLKSVDFIAAEDTRVTAKLLSRYGIKKPTVSYHEHNRKYAGPEILARIEAGETCAVVTDAGMPCISDPGEDLVRFAAERGIRVEVVPGPSAVVSALAVSGLDTSKFAFEGFLSTAPNSRKEALEACAKEPRTVIFYEAPHKLVQTLNDLYKYFGERKISICRELTKLHEEVIRTVLSEAVTLYDDESRKPKGEFVLVVEGYKEAPKADITIEEAVGIAREMIEGGMKKTEACRAAAKRTGFSKSEIYGKLEGSSLEKSGF